MSQTPEEFVEQFKRRYKCLTCGTVGFPDPIIGCTACGFDDMLPVDDEQEPEPKP